MRSTYPSGQCGFRPESRNRSLVGNDLAVPLSLAEDELGIPIFGAEIVRLDPQGILAVRTAYIARVPRKMRQPWAMCQIIATRSPSHCDRLTLDFAAFITRSRGAEQRVAGLQLQSYQWPLLEVI